MLGLWSLTGDGASFNAGSAASVAADVRWKKLTGIFGQPFQARLTCSLCAPGDGAGPRGLLAFVWSRIACAGGGSRAGWPRIRVCLVVSYRPLATLLQELARRRATSKASVRCSRGAPISAASGAHVSAAPGAGSTRTQQFGHARVQRSSCGTCNVRRHVSVQAAQATCMRRFTLAAAALARARETERAAPWRQID